MDQAVAGAESVFYFGNAVSAAGAENNLVFSVNLPVSINDKDMIGLLLLQNDATVLTLRVSNAPAAALMTDTDVTATITGTWEIMLEYFSVPANTKDYPVLTKVHQVLENQVPLNNIGQNKIPMPRGNTYMRIIDCIKLGGKLADAVENAKLVYNLNNTPYDISGGMMKVMHRERYGRDLPKGVYVWDFFYQGIANMGNHRDFVNSAAISEFDQILNIAVGSTFGNSDNVCSMIMDQLVDVVPVAG